MKENQPGLDGLTRDPKAAGLLKNRALLQSLLDSPDARRMLELLQRSGGQGLRDAAARGDAKALAGMIRQVAGTREGAALAQRLGRAVPPDRAD